MSRSSCLKSGCLALHSVFIRHGGNGRQCREIFLVVFVFFFFFGLHLLLSWNIEQRLTDALSGGKCTLIPLKNIKGNLGRTCWGGWSKHFLIPVALCLVARVENWLTNGVQYCAHSRSSISSSLNVSKCSLY